jgi:hypothetical protein
MTSNDDVPLARIPKLLGHDHSELAEDEHDKELPNIPKRLFQASTTAARLPMDATSSQSRPRNVHPGNND